MSLYFWMGVREGFCFSRSVEDENAVGASYCQTMDDLLKESDFVVLAVDLTPETTRLISHKELSLMKPTATLVNISRGQEKYNCCYFLKLILL